MATYYLDYVNGNDTNNGSSWALAWKTITSGATAARIAPGDVIRIAKSPAPVSVGNGSWTDNTLTAGGFPATKSVTGAANNGSGLIRVTATGHGYSTGDIIQIISVAGAVEANGAWRITYVSANTFDLEGSAFGSAYTSGGSAQKINSKAVVLATAQTKYITDCEKVWTANAGGDATCAVVAVFTDAKEGSNCHRITLDAAVQTSKLEAYFAIPTTDFSAYQGITFWIKNNAAIADGASWKVTLCSDTAGATPVDTFVIPAIPSTARWLPLTIMRTGGGNLGASIQSIAVSTGTTAPANSSNILLDNIHAVTTSGLNLQSLISKNSAEQGGTEGWYGIQSISYDGRVILLDNDTNIKSNEGRGWCGTTETVTTYIRETTKTAMDSGGYGVVQQVMDSGTSGNNIQFQAGYDTGTGLQTGSTIFDGLNGNGYGIQLSSKSYITFNNVGVVRYNYGLYVNASHNNTFTTIPAANNNTYAGFFITAAINNVFTSILAMNNNTTYGLSSSNSCRYNVFTSILAINNNGTYGIHLNSAHNSIFTAISAIRNNSAYGIVLFSSLNNIFRQLNLSGNTNGAINNDYGITHIGNASIAESTEFSGAIANAHSRIFSNNHDNAGYEYIYSDSAYAVSLSDGAGGKKWAIYPTAAARDIFYPFDLLIAKAYIAASSLVTVTLKMNKSHATNIGAKLVVKGAIVGGVETEQSATAASSTGDQTVSLTFTPSAAGVIEVYAYGYWIAAAANVTVDQSGTTPIIQQA